MHGLRYSERPASPALRPFVACLWRLRGPALLPAPPPERVLPDGSIEMIVHLGDPFVRGSGEGRPERQPDSFVVGQLTGPLFIGPAGRVDVLGIRFRPGGLAPFTSLPISELTGRAVPLEDLWGYSGRELAMRLTEAEARGRPGGSEAPDALFAGQIAPSGDRLPRPEPGMAAEAEGPMAHELLEAFLTRRLSLRGADRMVPDPAIEGAQRGPAGESVERMAGRLGLCVRQLQRLFAGSVGLPPRLFSRIRRFDGVVRRLGSGPSPSLAEVAVEGGYADQAHLTREFREFAGITPGAYRRERLPLSDLFTGAGRGDAT